MQHLKVFYTNPQKHLLHFEFTVEAITTTSIEVQLSAWRPGRYELQNFAKNIQTFTVLSKAGEVLPFRKLTKDRWKIDTTHVDAVVIAYTYYALQLDAGGTVLDEDLCYINWITCAMYVEGRQHEPYEVLLQVPHTYKVACGMKHIRNEHGVVLFAENFYRLTAAPLVSSATLQNYSYTLPNLDTEFNIWIQGKWKPDQEQLLADFTAFTETQVKLFAAEEPLQIAFPESSYHFLFIILPYSYHHGVEHYNSTVLVMGVNPEQDFHKERYTDVLAISSHELFHFWNICRIRPVELLPYDYTKETYFETGFVAEGVTTYYGDYLLARSHVWTFEEYTTEFNHSLQRHFENFGRYNYSVAESSWDLWLDGYVAGIPNRKVSIYTEGALATLILDLEIRKATRNAKNFDDVMRYLWNEFALQNKGYSVADYQQAVTHVAGQAMTAYFKECIFGRGYIEKWLPTSLAYVGCEIRQTNNTRLEEHVFGFRIAYRANRILVTLIVPNSPADTALALQDELLSLDNQPMELTLNGLLRGKKTVVLQILRNNKLKTILLEATEKTYLPTYSLAKLAKPTPEQKENFANWVDI